MAKSKKLESKKLEELLAGLTKVRNNPTSETSIAVLQQILNSKFSIAIAQAAKVIGEAEMRSLIPELTATFSKFMVNGAEIDPSCKAKQQIAEALYRLNYSEESLFLQGIQRLSGLLAIAMLRQDQALDFLLALVATGNKRDRDGAIGALKMYQSDAILWQRVQEARAGGTPSL